MGGAILLSGVLSAVACHQTQITREMPSEGARIKALNEAESLYRNGELERALLKYAELRRYRWLSEPQLLTRSGDRALSGDHPEVQQVVVVQPVHPNSIYS